MCILQMWPVDWNSLPKCWFLLFRMESTEKCEAIIQHFNGKFIKIPPGVPGACQRLCFFQSGEADVAAAGAQTSVLLCWLLPPLSHVWLLQCLRSPYYVSLQTEVRRRGRTRGNTSRTGGPGPEMETRWASHFRGKKNSKHELPASHSCRGSKSKTCFESCSVFPSSFTPWLTLFCVFFF